jgi:hypothetical protein
MTAERVAKLDKLGFAWCLLKSGAVANDAHWEAQLVLLAAYKATHGNCNVPHHWVEDPRLGCWVNHQRRNKRSLDCGEPSCGMTAARAAKLTALGLTWDPGRGKTAPDRDNKINDTGWEATLARLAAYKQAHGDGNVPHGWAEDPQLATWVTTQRRSKRKLDRGEPSNGMTGERAARLTAFGFVWDPGPCKGGAASAAQEVEWEAQLARLVAHKAEYGDCNVPQRWAEDPQLGTWVHKQRQNKRAMDRGEPCNRMSAELAMGDQVIKCRSPLNVLKNTSDHSFY